MAGAIRDSTHQSAWSILIGGSALRIVAGFFYGSISDYMSVFSPLFFWKDKTSDASDLMMTPLEAVLELERRQKDPELKKKVEEYLDGDVPEYFKDGPILYLARHIATPNFETLRLVHLMRELGMKIIVSQDTKDLFVPHNQLKKALCKLSILRGISQKGNNLNEQYQNVTIVDFNTANGKRFDTVTTLWGEKLIDFHARLFSQLIHGNIESPDDAAWIDRHHRGNLLEHYKQSLALFVTHGIFFDDYPIEDEHEISLVRRVLRPAYRFIEQRFGLRPIIVQLVPKTFESNRFWISYPKDVLDIVRASLTTVK